MRESNKEEIAVINFPTQGMPRDVRIAKALLEYLAAESTTPGHAQRIGFTMYEEDGDVMSEICNAAEWMPRNWDYMRRTLSAVASRLSTWRYLNQYEQRHNQEAMEDGEPRKWFVYEMPLKYRGRLNPNAWPGYSPEWTPERELEYMLRRVFDYEAPAATVAA